MKKVLASFMFMVLGLFSLSAFAGDDASMFVTVESPYGYEETVDHLKSAIVDNNFQFIRQQEVAEGLQVTLPSRALMVFFCNFAMLHEVLQFDQQVGIGLPCRFTVRETAGKVFISYVDPRYYGHQLGDPRLTEYCKKLAKAYKAIVEEATL